MKSVNSVEHALIRAGGKPLNPAVRDTLLALLEFLNNFLHKWFLTPEGERKSFWVALLSAFYKDFWKDLFGVKDHLDKVIDEL